MNTLVEKFVKINGLDLESEEINEVLQSFESNDLSSINKVFDYLIQEQKGGDSVFQTLSQLTLKEKFFLIALIVNKSNDLLLYPVDLREKQMQVWAENIQVNKDLIRAVMIVGGEKILNEIKN